MKAAIYFGHGQKIGLGHFKRCLCLANHLADEKIKSVFFLEQHDPNIEAEVVLEGHQLCTIDDEFWERQDPNLKYISKFERVVFVAKKILSAEILILDDYTQTAHKTASETHRDLTIVVIDDLANRYHHCDILLDQNYFGHAGKYRYQKLVPENSTLLCGPRYALLDKCYQNKISQPFNYKTEKTILICFGGTDCSELIHELLGLAKAFSFDHLTFEIILGNNTKINQDLIDQFPFNIKIETYVRSMYEKIKHCDISIGAGGSMNWQRLALGKPSIVTSIAKNQIPINEALFEDQYIVYVGEYSKDTARLILNSLNTLLNDVDKQLKMTEASTNLVDGYGANRVVAAIKDKTTPKR